MTVVPRLSNACAVTLNGTPWVTGPWTFTLILAIGPTTQKRPLCPLTPPLVTVILSSR